MLVSAQVDLVLENKSLDIPRGPKKRVAFQGAQCYLVRLCLVEVRGVLKLHPVIKVHLKLSPAGFSVQSVARQLEGARILVLLADVTRGQTDDL